MKLDFVATKNIVNPNGEVLVKGGEVAAVIESVLPVQTIVNALTTGAIVTKEQYEKSQAAKAQDDKSKTVKPAPTPKGDKPTA